MLKNSYKLISFCLGLLLSQIAFSLTLHIDSSETSRISFLNFEATVSSKIIHFKWQITSEKNGDHFLIEKSLDGHKWKTIARVESKKNHNNLETYLTSVINLVEGAHEIFRIIRVDQSGEIEVLTKINVEQPILNYLFAIPVSGKPNKEMITSCNSLLCSAEF